MGFKDWIIHLLGGGKNKKVGIDEIMTDANVRDSIYEIYLRELAFWSCVNKIAGAIVKCEFQTFRNHKEIHGEEYYLWNYEPNPNQNAAAMIFKLIGILYKKNEALIVEVGRNIYVADNYEKEIFALKEYQFKNVEIDGYTLSETFYMSDVLFFQLNSADMRKLVNGMYEAYSKLLTHAQNAYRRSRGRKGILNISATAEQSDAFDQEFDDLMTKHFKNFFEKENAVLPLFDGYEYTDISQNVKTYSSESTRDIKALADDIYDFTARAFSFPPSLAKGDVQDTGKAVDELLTFVVDPLVKILQTEINRKRYGLSGIKKGDYMKINTLAVKHIDIFDIAAPMEKLISSGVFTINDILKVLKMQTIDEKWADQHFITKNYATIQDLLNNLGGGGRIEEQNELADGAGAGG